MKRFAGALYLMTASLLVATAGCNTDSLPPASGFANVSGVIVDAATKAPIAGAVITVDTVLTATTDAAGKFSIDKVPSGLADYAVSAKGYQTLTSSANVEPGKFELDLTLAPPSPH
ncbi:MAG: carboxypeptidase regulatory-like domain-containing protein [Candidatus Eremiobacteraeota bacterium]|nr:carboxypeptidase regulatory-like domain-containing protein [Candidatus Eremiobacteraeota bacterium]